MIGLPEKEPNDRSVESLVQYRTRFTQLLVTDRRKPDVLDFGKLEPVFVSLTGETP